MRNSFYSSIAKQLQQDQEELEAAEKITKIVFPIIEGLNRSQIVNPVILKTKLMQLDPKYRDVVYGLCRIAVEGGPEGSFIVLDSQKVLSLLDEIEAEDHKKRGKHNKKFIIGITKKVVSAIKGMVVAKLSALCHLVNDLVTNKVVNVPSPDKLKAAGVKITSLGTKQNRSR